MPQPPDRLPAGIDPLDIRPWLDALRDYVVGLGVTVATDGDLVRMGNTIGHVDNPGWWGKLTYHASGNSYSWLEQVPSGFGTWIAGFNKGYVSSDPGRGTVPADPAYEANNNAAVAVGTFYWMTRDNGQVNFRAPACS